MKIVRIEEDIHGLLGVALNYYNAVKWLIDDGWIDDDTEVWVDWKRSWEKLKDVQGEDWADAMLEHWDIDDFNDFWEGSFLLQSMDVIGAEEEE